MSAAHNVEPSRKRLPQPPPRLLVPNLPSTVIEFTSKDGRPFTMNELWSTKPEDLVEKMVNGGDKPLSYYPKGPIKLDVAWPGYRHKIEVGISCKMDITRAELATKLAYRIMNYVGELSSNYVPDSEWMLDRSHLDGHQIYLVSLWEFRTRWYRAELEVSPISRNPTWIEVYRSP